MSLTTKQKVLLPILIIVVGFLAWQVYLTLGMFINEGIDQSQDKAKQQAQEPQMVNLPVAKTSASEFTKVDANNVDNQAINLNQDQTQYIRLVHRYQLLQMKKMIAESSQAIAESNLKAAQANAQLAKFQMQEAQNNIHDTTSYTKLPAKIKTAANNSAANNPRKSNNNAGLSKTTSKNRHANEKYQNSKPVATMKSTKSLQITNKALNSSSTAAIKSDSLLSEGLSDAKQSVVIIPGVKLHPKMNKTKLAEKHQTNANVSASDLKQSSIKAGPKTNAKKVNADHSKRTMRVSKPLTVANAKQAEATKHKSHGTKLEASQQAILATNPKHYTVQLIADKDLKFVKQYQRKFNLAGQSHYYRVYQYGRPLYALISGDYKTVPAAVAAINNLPKRMTKWSPFVRRIGIIQDEIRIAEKQNQHSHG